MRARACVCVWADVNGWVVGCVRVLRVRACVCVCERALVLKEFVTSLLIISESVKLAEKMCWT